jgi:hypothetical protein
MDALVDAFGIICKGMVGILSFVAYVKPVLFALQDCWCSRALSGHATARMTALTDQCAVDSVYYSLCRLCQKAFTIETLRGVVAAVNEHVGGVYSKWDAVADTG